MTPITYAEFIRYLESYGTAVHCEMYTNYTRYHDEDDSALYYYDRGCAVTTEEYDYNDRRWIWRRVHQVTSDGAVSEVSQMWLEEAKQLAEEYPGASVNVIAFTVSNGELTPEQNRHYGWRNYARMGEPVSRDPTVRCLTAADLPRIKATCAPSLTEGGDNGWGRQLARDFDRMDFYEGMPRMFGIFDGDTLVGMATSSYEKGIDLGWLRDVYVVPAYRGKGYGKRLVRSALADYPDKKWHYQAARDNDLSVALAKSLGFTLEGAGLFL